MAMSSITANRACLLDASKMASCPAISDDLSAGCVVLRPRWRFMRNIKRQLIFASVIASFGASVALACIPEFGWQLLDNRAATLDKMPVGERSFAWSEAH